MTYSSNAEWHWWLKPRIRYIDGQWIVSSFTFTKSYCVENIAEISYKAAMKWAELRNYPQYSYDGKTLKLEGQKYAK